ncbi:hypothetical protein BJX66DRAFT_295143 [Aspergillus keveii]|uniref:Uncharacterized protein n=1 Tax=Aspergillus keveii TaxID=714993 RepID=A0ABR4GHM7_9EURO
MVGPALLIERLPYQHLALNISQNVALSTCLLQVWQHWPLRWLVAGKGINAKRIGMC